MLHTTTLFLDCFVTMIFFFTFAPNNYNFIIMEILSAFLFFATIALPFLFQILFGSGIIPLSRKIPFWVVCIISVFLWAFTFYYLYQRITTNLREMGSRDGLPSVFLAYTEIFIAIITVITMIIQVAIKYYRKRKKRVST